MIEKILHPTYSDDCVEWGKWRLVYEGGRPFIDYYLEKMSAREADADFEFRRKVSYAPSHAKTAVNEIKAAVFQRLDEVKRVGGHATYQAAIQGTNGGVDAQGRDMTNFLATELLPDLLTMRKVGVYVDMPELSGNLVAHNLDKRPYIYSYPVESIRSWSYKGAQEPGVFSAVLLEDNALSTHEKFDLPYTKTKRLRYVYLNADGFVNVEFYSCENGEQIGETVHLQLREIPFTILELKESLLKDVADVQIALLNICSSDVTYLMQANRPFYVEPFDPRHDPEFWKKRGEPFDDDATAGSAASIETAEDNNIDVGGTHGRRYPKDSSAPQYIHPSAEPLLASMKKQEQLETLIRRLVHLATVNQPKMESAASKKVDREALIAGLRFIGKVCEHAERKIGQYWSSYTGAKPPQITYPENYDIRSEEEKNKEIQENTNLLSAIPSKTWRVELCKTIATLKLENTVSAERLKKVLSEIEDAPAIVSKPDDITVDLDHGLVTAETASNLRGYDGSVEVPKAQEEKAKRMEMTARAQGGLENVNANRGLPDFDDGGDEDGKNKRERGEGKKVDKNV